MKRSCRPRRAQRDSRGRSEEIQSPRASQECQACQTRTHQRTSAGFRDFSKRLQRTAYSKQARTLWTGRRGKRGKCGGVQVKHHAPTIGASIIASASTPSTRNGRFIKFPSKAFCGRREPGQQLSDTTRARMRAESEPLHMACREAARPHSSRCQGAGKSVHHSARRRRIAPMVTRQEPGSTGASD